jgi:hypothetical protein
MIKNISQLLTRSQKTIHILNESGFEFFPTGSRYMGGMQKDSDYDFFADYNPAIEDWLLSLGFEHDRTAYFEDDLSTMVYRIEPDFDNNGDVIPGFEGFDIQLVKNVGTKQMIQNILMSRYSSQEGYNGLPGSKSERSELWNLVHHTLTSLGLVQP